jgi:hypothetical protein
VTILASYSKHRRDDVLPLPSGLAARLTRWLAGKAPGCPVFVLPDKPHKMFYRDLGRARIDRETASGVIDLHGLRHTLVSDVVASGATAKTAQELARHSTPTLTFNVYAHARLHDVASTVQRLPDPFESKQPQTLADTRTDLAAHWQRAEDGSGRFESAQDVMTGSNAPAVVMGPVPEKQASGRIQAGLVGTSQQARPVGFEPTTFGFEDSGLFSEYVQEHPELTPSFVDGVTFARDCDLMPEIVENCEFSTLGSVGSP